MDEERIWAPWRIGYIVGEKLAATQIPPTRWLPDADQGCFLCRCAASYAEPHAANRQNLVLASDEQVIGVLNRYPYNNGHLLVAPLRHVSQLGELTDAEHLAAMHMLSRFTAEMSAKIGAEGFNVGLNLGKIAGAGVPGHLHWHLVPRWSGDTNFMASVGGIRVIPQSLEALWEALAESQEGRP